MKLDEIKHLIAGMSVQELAAVSRVLMPKLIAVAEAAKAYVNGETPYYDTPLAEALAALETK